MQDGSQTYICASHLFPLLTFWLKLAFEYVVLVGGFAASDWLFNQVHEKLVPHGLNIIQPVNHVFVPPSLRIHPILTCRLGTRLCLMAPCLSTTTALYALEYPSLLMEPFAISTLIPLTRTTNKDATIHLLILPGNDLSRIFSMSSCQRFVYFLRDCSPLNNMSMKNTQISETKEFRRPLETLCESKNEFKRTAFSVWCYRGAVVAPTWKDVDTRQYLFRLQLRNIT